MWIWDDLDFVESSSDVCLNVWIDLMDLAVGTDDNDRVLQLSASSAFDWEVHGDVTDSL